MNAINSLLEKDISTQFHVPEFILFGAEQHFTVWTSRGGVYRIHGGQWALTHPQPNTRTCVISLDPQMLKGRQAGFTVPFEQMESPWFRSGGEGPQSSPPFPLCSTQSQDPPLDKLSSDVLNPP